jgi:hypothetical protein
MADSRTRARAQAGSLAGRPYDRRTARLPAQAPRLMQGARLVMTLELLEATPSNNVLKGMHYRVCQKTRRDWQMLVLAAAEEMPAHPIQRSYLEIDRHSAGGGLDWDNAYGGLKPLLDCLVSPSERNPDGLAIIEDDNPCAMPLPPFIKQLPAKRGAGRTVVRIYDAAGVESAPESWLS